MYRNTDLSEIVHNPSPITAQYLNIWFCGNGSFGKALTLLGWPVYPSNTPLLVWDEKNGLRVDMRAEDKIMYSHTLYQYVRKNNEYVLQMNFKKLSITTIFNTMRVVWSQSKLLMNYQNTYNTAKRFIENIPLHASSVLPEIEKTLKDKVWPHVIAVDYIGEYIVAIITHKLPPEEAGDTLNTIHMRVRAIDWYTQGMLAWSKYKDGMLSEHDLVTQYGYCAGDDYELTRPRYYELLKKPKPQIHSLEIKNMDITSIEDLAVGMQYLRSEAKRRSLIWIAALRESLIENKIIDESKN